MIKQRQIQLSGDATASGNFDGSQNLNLATTLSLIATNLLTRQRSFSARTFTEVTVDQKGRVVNAKTASQMNLTLYGLDGSATSDTSLAMPWSARLQSIVDESGTGLIARTGSATVATRTIQTVSTDLVVTNGNGVSGNPNLL